MDEHRHMTLRSSFFEVDKYLQNVRQSLQDTVTRNNLQDYMTNMPTHTALHKQQLTCYGISGKLRDPTWRGNMERETRRTQGKAGEEGNI